MPSLDLVSLTRHVQVILANPAAQPPATGDPLLDGALADLACLRRAGQALPALAVYFWTPAAVAPGAHGG